MSTFYDSPNDYRNYLCHYGVKGMKWRHTKKYPTNWEYIKDGMHRGDRGIPDRLRSTDDAIRDNLRGPNSNRSSESLRDHRIRQIRKLETRFDRKRNEHDREEHDRQSPFVPRQSNPPRGGRGRHELERETTIHPNRHKKKIALPFDRQAELDKKRKRPHLRVGR